MISKSKFTLLLLLLLLIGLGSVHPSQAQGDPPSEAAKAKIEPQLLEDLESANTADYFLWLTAQADLDRVAQLPTREAKGEYVFNALRQQAETSQKALRAYLDNQSVSYEPYYITNAILVRGGSRELLFALAARPDVARILANHTFQMPEPIRGDKRPAHPAAIEPNVTFINADDVWGLGITGANTVMAGNDTGLDWDHPAIINHYRGWNGSTADHNYNWWDATSTYPSTPDDGHGHGTHTTGTMVGDDGSGNQIGVAPGARTIHCKNMDNGGGGLDSWFLTCFQWDLAPWDLSGSNPRPDLAPDAINNSWGYWGGGNPIFQSAIANLQAAGIVVEVSAGNEGPSCSSLRSPGDYGEVLTTGSVNHMGGTLPGTLTAFSSRGPSSLSGDFLPDIMAPGEGIRSSLPGGAYDSWSGTSMAGPHATALVGLMWSANPGLRGFVPETLDIMAQTAVPLAGQVGSNCGGDYTNGPNHDWGYGTIDALAAVQAAIAFGDPGTLTGVVTDATTNDPLAGALVRAALPSGLGWQRQTNDNGLYSMFVFSGTYTVTTNLYGYYPAVNTGVQVTSFTTTTVNIALNPAPAYTVSGVVTDATTGWPLYASIAINGYPGDPVWTDPETGQYNISLAAGTSYTFHVTPWVSGYDTAVRAVGPLTGDQTEDFALDVNQFTCNAPGYEPQFVYFEDFEAGDGGYTTEGFSSWQWGTPTSGPGTAHSGSNVWATNLSGNHNNGEMGYTTSPIIDLSAYTGQKTILTWWQWLQTEQGYDYGFVEVSNDGGSSWYLMYGWADGNVSPTWQKQSVVLDSYFTTANFRVRFGFSSDGSVTYPGFYVDDVGIGIPTAPPVIYSQDFEVDDGSFTVGGTNSSWAWGTPTRGPGFAHSGFNAWGTNLDENYNNNETSQITSPIIDLSSYTGQMVKLAWWQWLQTELGYDFASVEISADGGTTWDPLYGPVSGAYWTDWYELVFILDPAYLVSDFQMRFTLDTDGSVTYPGFYVDDITLSIYTGQTPTLPCVAPTGGLIVGNVYDANLGHGVNGAVVSSDVSGSTTSQATPLDTAVADGFYTLYAPAGSNTLTASKEAYADQSLLVNVAGGSTTPLDFTLETGLLAATPPSLSATLDMGSTTNLDLTLQNNGGLAANFLLRERNRGMTPVRRGSGAPLQEISGHFSPAWRSETAVSSDQPDHTPTAPPWTDITPYPRGIMDNAAAWYEGRVYSVGGLDDTFQMQSGGYVYDPDTTSWSPIANMSYSRQKPTAAFVDDLLYVVGGWDESGNTVSALEIYNPTTDSWTLGANVPVPVSGAPAAVLEGQLYVIGGCLDGMCTPTSNVFRYDVDANTWAAVAPYPDAVSWQSCGAMDDLIYCTGGVAPFGESNRTYAYDPATDAWTQLADLPITLWASAFTPANEHFYVSSGVTNNFSTVTNQTFVYDPITNAWIQDANANTAVYRSGSACGFYKIGGSDGGFSPVANVEVYPDLTNCGEASDVTWLTTTPITGTVNANGSQLIQVTLDAGVPEITQPGDYLAEIKVVDNTPYQMDTIAVAMTVNAPASWGKVAGIVTGLARCDTPGGALAKATLEIDGNTIQSDDAGNFGYWLPAGAYTLTVSKAGYTPQTLNVTVTAGQTTTRDVDLRLTRPCTDSTPGDFNVTLPAGTTATADLNLSNTGAGNLTYVILETTQDVSLTRPTLYTPDEATLLYSTAAPIGPLSARTLAGQNTSGTIPDTPESNWFAGADHPDGIIRYGHAQCNEQPHSFYVISGVNGDFTVTKSAWRYDSDTNTWAALAPMPAGQEGPAAVCYQGRIYVMGGGGSNQFYIYDIANDTWHGGAPLPRDVWSAAAAAWDGKVYLVGGDSDFFPGDTANEVNIYDIATDTWTGTGAPMPYAAVAAGYVQAGSMLYVVGGWNDSSPTTNVAATQRYDLAANAWETGPALAYPRADLALAMTNQALYAIGGDNEGNGYFEATTTVERLDLTGGLGGSWSDAIDQLPTRTTANQAGFCTAGFFPAQVWSVGGLAAFGISGNNRFLGRPNETCFAIYEDIPWLTATPPTGTVTADSSEDIVITFDATGLTPGNYTATLVVNTNDSGAPLMQIPVLLTVTEATSTSYMIFLPMITKNN